jgi:hypothetical protein
MTTRQWIIIGIIAVGLAILAWARSSPGQPTTQPVHIDWTEIQFLDGTKYTTTQPAWRVQTRQSDGKGATFVLLSTPRPATQPAYKFTVRVGRNETIKTAADVSRTLKDDTEYLFARGETFDVKTGIAVWNNKVRFAAQDGPGFNPVFKWTGTAAYHVDMIIAKKDGLVVEDVNFDGGISAKARAITISGTNTIVRRCTPLPTLLEFVRTMNADNVLVEDCHQEQPLRQHWMYTAPVSRNVTVRNCTGAAPTVSHVLRTHGLIGGTFSGCRFLGGTARSAINIRDGENITLTDNTIIGNCGFGPLGDGANTDMSLRLKNVTLRANRIKLKDMAAINLEMGASGIVIEGNDIDTPADRAVVVTIDNNYTQRGRPTATLKGNAIIGPSGTRLVAGPRDGITASGNKINGVDGN